MSAEAAFAGLCGSAGTPRKVCWLATLVNGENLFMSTQQNSKGKAVALWILVATVVIGLVVGAVYVGRLDVRVTALES